METPGLQLREVEDGVVAVVEATAERAALDPEAVRLCLAEAGFGACFVLEDAVASLLDRYRIPTTEFQIKIAERRDARFSLETTPDFLQTWVDWQPAYGGQSVAPEAISAALGAAGITFGIDAQAIEQVCRATQPLRVRVAQGHPVEHGLDTRFELLVADTRDRTPRVNEHGLIDFRELGAIPVVVAGQPLMRRIPPTNGVAGINVRGEVIEPTPGRNEPFPPNLVGAHVSPEDPNLLLAVFTGQPVRCGNGVMVEQVLRVANVDMASGNIHFEGTVHVEGEVLPGMKVDATGDIVVAGVVDGGELNAAGDIQIGGGIIAHAKVKAGGAVTARFVENGHVHAGTTITIEDMALQSDLQALNQIIIGTKARERGRLVGGSARAQLLVQAPIVGANSGGVTTILLGVNPVLDAQYQDVLHRIEKQKVEEANLEKLLKHLTTHGDKGGMLEKVKASWEHAVQAWGALLAERDALEHELALNASARLVVGVGVGGPLDLTFGRKMLKVNTQFGSGAFLIEGEQIIFTTDKKA